MKSGKTVGRTVFATVVALGVAGAVASAGEITVVSWGGAYTKSQVEAYHKPWFADTGNTVISEDYDGNVATVKAQVESGNVTWDVVDVELGDAVRLCDQGLLEPIDLSLLPNGSDGTPAMQDFLPGALSECYVPTIAWSTVFAYNTEVFPGNTAPTKAADFFDLKRFPGRRGLRKSPKVTLEFALMADGVAPARVYELLETPQGVARAFAKLDAIKDDAVWWSAGAQPPQLLVDKEVVMSTAYNGRIFNAAVQEKKPLKIVWDAQTLDLDVWVVPRGTPKRTLAMEFVGYSTTTKALADQAKWIAYGPMRKSSAPLVGLFQDGVTSMAEHMPTDPRNQSNSLVSSPEFWADNFDQLNEQFQNWLLR